MSIPPLPPPRHHLVIEDVASDISRIIVKVRRYSRCLSEFLNELKFYQKSDPRQVAELIMVSYTECYADYSSATRDIYVAMRSGSMDTLRRTSPGLYQYIYNTLRHVALVVEGVNAIGDFILAVANLVFRLNVEQNKRIFESYMKHVNNILSMYGMSYVRPRSFLSYRPLYVLVKYQIAGLEYVVRVLQPSLTTARERIIDTRMRGLEELVNILGFVEI